jgi:acetolactate synthase-1/2/3 large subunit
VTTVAERLAQTLQELGIRYVFGVPSGGWVDYMEALRAQDGIEFVLVSNEASGGFMADVCWRVTGTPAACFGTFGPGACNLTTGVGSALLDRSPMLVFTDEMSDAMLQRVTQMNIDHQALFRSITKWTTRLQADSVKKTLCQALQIATSEVPGPVHIGLPSGISASEAAHEDVQQQPATGAPPPDPVSLDKMAALFAEARKPILALGITAMRAPIQALVLKVAEKFQVPVVLTPMAKGMVPEDHPSYAGVLAHALANQVGETHQQADLIVGLGYDPVEINYEDWMPDVPLLNINTVPADLDQTRYTLACDVVGDLKPALERLVTLNCDAKKDWDLTALAQRRHRMFEVLRPSPGHFGPRAVLATLREMLPENGIMTCDVGSHLHLIGQAWRTPAPECQLMTNGWSSMGFGIPAAIAAKLCMPERPVACVVGDGGFLMMVGEMATAMRLGTQVVFVLITDRNLSLIRLKQQRKGNERYGTLLYPEGYASAETFFGVPVFAANTAKEYQTALKHAFAANSPAIVEAFVDTGDYDEFILKGNR